MRWILVILFLYMVPLIILFKNNKSFKRSCIYGSIYTVVASVIVISNVYISGIEKIRDSLTYNYYASDEERSAKKDVNDDNQVKESMNNNIENKIEKTDEHDESNENKSTEYIEADTASIKTDSELVYQFKSKVYEIEREALIPMRECMPNSQTIVANIANIEAAKVDVALAREKCEEVINLYEELEIPELSDSEYESALLKAKLDVQQAYVLREQAMESAEKLLETKNLKYIGEIKDYLSYSDNYIKDFITKIKEVQNNIK